MSSDRIVLPPVHREFGSADGRYRLVIESTDQWKTPRPQARLLQTDAGQTRVRWTLALNHHHGPRRAAVSNDGQVLLVDEWINIASRWALMLINVDGQVVATHDYKAVEAAMRASPAEMTRHARSGVWLGDGPILSVDGKSARLEAAGRGLSINLVDGSLSLVR